MDKDLSNESLSQQFYVSKYYLMHKFKEHTGYTLHAYVQQKRLLHAKDLIQEDVPVLKAASMCGFSDYSTFLRAFRKFYGISPKAFHTSGCKAPALPEDGEP